jgi:hypothetical protein
MITNLTYCSAYTLHYITLHYITLHYITYIPHSLQSARRHHTNWATTAAAHLFIFCCILRPVIVSIDLVVALAITRGLGPASAAGASTLTPFLISLTTCDESSPAEAEAVAKRRSKHVFSNNSQQPTPGQAGPWASREHANEKRDGGMAW